MTLPNANGTAIVTPLETNKSPMAPKVEKKIVYNWFHETMQTFY